MRQEELSGTQIPSARFQEESRNAEAYQFTFKPFQHSPSGSQPSVLNPNYKIFKNSVRPGGRACDEREDSEGSDSAADATDPNSLIKG